MADLTDPISYNGVTAVPLTLTPGGAAEVGTTIVSFDIGQVPVSVKIEKRALADGSYHSDAWLSGRLIPIEGQVYGSSAGDMWDRINAWLAAFSPRSPTLIDTVETSTVTTSYEESTLTDTFREVWHADILTKPTGIRYDPADTANIKVIDGVTRCIYTVRQSDQTIIATSSAISGTYFLGMSGDPGDATSYWLLDCPWKAGGALTGNKILKMKSSDNSVLATYAIANGRWTDLKADATNLWLTNWDTNKLHKFSKVGVEITTYSITYQGVAQVDPTGIAIDGTELIIAYVGTGRLLVVDSTSPTTVAKTYNTTGTSILGGEFDVTTHTDLYFCSDSVGRIWKYTLVDASITSTIISDTVSVPVENDMALHFHQPTADATNWPLGYIPMRMHCVPVREPAYRPIRKEDAAPGPHAMAVSATLLAPDPYKYYDDPALFADWVA